MLFVRGQSLGLSEGRYRPHGRGQGVDSRFERRVTTQIIETSPSSRSDFSGVWYSAF